MTATRIRPSEASLRSRTAVPIAGSRTAPLLRAGLLEWAAGLLSRAYRHAALLRQLRTLDDRLLADIGLKRADLQGLDDAALKLELAERGWHDVRNARRRSGEHSCNFD